MKNTPKKRPAEYGTPTAYGIAYAVLVALGLDGESAAAWAGVAAAVAPALITFARQRGWL